MSEKKITMFQKVVWNLPSLTSNGLWGIMAGYLTYYLTQSVLLSSASVGGILMASKIFDGFTDLIAGYIIEKTNSKWGKGRPYSLFASVAWVFIILIFAVPSFFSTTAKLTYVFVCYTLINSVALTFFNCSEQVYMLRAMPNEKDKSSTLAIGGAIVTYGSTILAIAMPIIITTLCAKKQGWTVLALAMGIPSIILAALRFVFVKEIPFTNETNDTAKKTKVSVLDMIKHIIGNKYVLICLGLVFFYYFNSNLGTIVTGYYFTYNVGNLTLLSIISATALITPIFLLFIPKMLEKWGKTKVLKMGLLCNLIACIVRALAPLNLVLYAITSLVCSFGTLPMVYFIRLLLMDCMDYGEWKMKYRVESAYSAVSSAGQKISAGVASGVAGLIMGATGFVSGADTQSTLAMAGIKGLTIYAPIIVGVILFVLISVYKLDDKMDQIKKEIGQNRE